MLKALQAHPAKPRHKSKEGPNNTLNADPGQECSPDTSTQMQTTQKHSNHTTDHNNTNTTQPKGVLPIQARLQSSGMPPFKDKQLQPFLGAVPKQAKLQS